MKLVLSRDYPHSPPRAFFLNKIYHPNVAPGGDICVNMLKRDWNADLTIGHMLQVGRTYICESPLARHDDWPFGVGCLRPTTFVKQVIRCLLIVPFPESSLNDEAGKLFMESYDEYARRARLLTAVHAQALVNADRKMPAASSTSSCSAASTPSGAGAVVGSTKALQVQRDRSKEKSRKSLQRL